WCGAVIVLSLSATGAAQDADGVIRGTAVDAVTRLPVLGAQVSITPAETAPDLITDPSGTFRFGGLDPDRYGIRVVKAGYRELFRFVTVKPGETSEALTLNLTPLAEISGRVLDEEGHAMEGVLVYTGANLISTSDKDGGYRFANLAPGDYVLAF